MITNLFARLRIFSLLVPIFCSGLYADDDTAIRAMLADIDTKITARDVEGVLAHYSTDYIHSGLDYDAISADLMENVPRVTSFHFTIAAIHVQGEFATVTGSIDGAMDDGRTFSWQEPAQGDEGIGLGWLKMEDAVWRVHGNQSRVGWFGVTAGHNLSGGNSFLRIAVESPFAIESATVSGPYIQPTSLTPDGYYGGVKGYATPSQRPDPGAEYRIEIVFSDGARETITDTIGAWVETAPELSVTTVYGTTTFSWTDVAADVPNAEHYMIFIQKSNGVDWLLSDIPLSQTSVVFNSDGTATGSLEPGQTYSAQIFIFNATGDYGYRFHYFMAQGSDVITGPATNVTSTSATLHGKVNPHGLVTSAWFEYGPTTTYGNTAAVTLTPNDGTSTQDVSAMIVGLLPDQACHYRLVATSSAGTSMGTDMTLPPPISPFEMTAPQLRFVANDVEFTIEQSIAGRRYQLQQSDTLEPDNWVDVETEWLGDGSPLVITIPRPPEVPRRFYRLALDPVPQASDEQLFWVSAISNPADGDVWRYGTEESIVWNNGLLRGSFVSIYVLHDNPVNLSDSNPDFTIVQAKNWFRFATEVANSGNHTVDPSMLSGWGNAYKILIVSDENYWSMSKGLFSLQP